MAELINCPTCDKQISSAAEACPECGHPLKEAPKAAEPSVKPKRGFSFGRVGCLLLVVIGAYVAWNWFPREGKDAISRLAGGPQTLFDEEFSVPSKGWQAKGFRLNRSAVVEVSIRSDGVGVDVYVVAEDEYKNFAAANQALFGGKFRHYPAFEMARAKRSSKRNRLSAGTYYVVVQNDTYGILTKSSFNVHLKVVLDP